MSCARGSLSVPVLVAFEALLVLPLLLPPFPLRSVVVCSLLAYLGREIFTSTTGDAATDWAIGLAVFPQLLKALYVYALRDARNDFWKIGETPGAWQALTLWKKLLWAFELVNTPRGVGWNWEVPYVCYVGTQSRSKFIVSRGTRIIWYTVLLAIAGQGHPSQSGKSIPTSSPLVLDSLLPVWSFAVGSYAQLWLIHTVPAFLVVLTGLDSHTNYPYVMGPIGAMNSVRTLWGRTWHQAVRAAITAFGTTVAWKGLGSRPGSVFSSYTQLVTGFLIGGLTHVLAGYMASDRCANKDETGATGFFALQLCAIIVEDVVFGFLQRTTGLKDWRIGQMAGGKQAYGHHLQTWNLSSPAQLIGYLTVICWLSWTLPHYVEGMRTAGALESQWALQFRVM